MEIGDTAKSIRMLFGDGKKTQRRVIQKNGNPKRPKPSREPYGPPPAQPISRTVKTASRTAFLI